MTLAQARNAYRQTEKMANVHPVKLIHLMYERVLAHLDIVVEAIDAKNVIQRGENLGKAIAIITELHASIKKDDDSEAAGFLRGLYSAILVELPKVSANNDREIATRTRTYIRQLMEIWEQTAMREQGLLDGGTAQRHDQIKYGPAPAGNEAKMGGNAVGKIAMCGLSFSI